MNSRRFYFRLGTAIVLSGWMLACQGDGGAGAPEGDFPRPSNVLLVTIDTLRADHLSSYGYPRRTSPEIDRLAEEGVRFEAAVAQWPKTGPSFASIFTATYPKDNHIVRRVGRPVPSEFRMLAEVLAAHGYATYAVVANGALAAELRYGQGFDVYHETWKSGRAADLDNRGSVVTQRAIGLAKRIDPSRPFFFWVHYIDPHYPYEPPPGWDGRFQGDPWYDPRRRLRVRSDRRRSEMLGIGFTEVLDGRRQLDFYVARYDAEIAYVDAKVGVLVEAFAEAGLMERTMTIVTADHGESLGDHDYYFSHGRFGYDACLRVPLVIHYPGVLAPRVDAGPVELIDLAPTILDAAGVPLADGRWMQGRSLLPRLAGGAAADDGALAFAEAGYPKRRNWQKIARGRRFKLIYAPDWADQRWITGRRDDAFALYDLDNDPGETVNLASELPDELERLQRALHAWWNAEPFDVRLDAANEDDRGEMDDETREQLKALGYLN